MANEGQGVPTPPATEKSKARARGVEHLQQLYTVATGLSLAVSIKNLIDTENINAAIPIEFSVIPYFASYIFSEKAEPHNRGPVGDHQWNCERTSYWSACVSGLPRIPSTT